MSNAYAKAIAIEQADYRDVGRVGVDSGRIAIIDPCHIPADVLEDLIARGCAAVYQTRYGDGGYRVTADYEGLHVEDVNDEWIEALEKHAEEREDLGP